MPKLMSNYSEKKNKNKTRAQCLHQWRWESAGKQLQIPGTIHHREPAAVSPRPGPRHKTRQQQTCGRERNFRGTNPTAKSSLTFFFLVTEEETLETWERERRTGEQSCGHACGVSRVEVSWGEMRWDEMTAPSLKTAKADTHTSRSRLRPATWQKMQEDGVASHQTTEIIFPASVSQSKQTPTLSLISVALGTMIYELHSWCFFCFFLLELFLPACHRKSSETSQMRYWSNHTSPSNCLSKVENLNFSSAWSFLISVKFAERIASCRCWKTKQKEWNSVIVNWFVCFPHVVHCDVDQKVNDHLK